MARFPRPRYADVAATLALVVALSTGRAYAASMIVGTNQIANGAVTTPKLANSAVTNAKLGGAAVTTGKIANGAVTSAKLAPAVSNAIVPPGGVIPHHVTVTGVVYAHGVTAPTSATNIGVVAAVNLPARAPVPLVESQMGFGPNSYGAPVNAHCTGTPMVPTAPPGWVCVYYGFIYGLTHPFVGSLSDLAQGRDAFRLAFNEPTLNTQYNYYGSWAYTAP